jgi:hypothetical protein
MFGISGIFSFSGPIDPRHIIAMTDIVRYRGMTMDIWALMWVVALSNPLKIFL